MTKPAAGDGAAGRVAEAAGLLVVTLFLGKCLGLVRDIVVAHYFGASAGIWADCYKAAFTLPDFFYYVIAGGAISSAFIPTFKEYLTKGSQAQRDGDTEGARRHEGEAWQVFSIFGTAITLGLTALILVGEIFAPWLLESFVVPGFTPEQIALTSALTRIIFPAQLCYFLGALMIGTLQSRNHFLIPALGPLVYNVVIIIGGVIGGTFFSPEVGIFGLCWGVLAGAIIGPGLMQLWAIRRVGVRFRPSLNVRHPGVVKVAKLMLPVIMGIALTQLHAMIARPFGSYLPQGSIAWLDNANKVMQLPLGIFAQAFGVALLPTLAALVAEGNLRELRRQFSLGLRSVLFLTIPSAALIVVLAVPLIAAMFQRGAWTPHDTEATASATVFYSLGIFAYSGAAIVNRGFYALQNTLTPMAAGLASTALYIGLNFLLMGPMEHNGLALSMAIAATVNLGILLWSFRRALNRRAEEVGDTSGERGISGREIASSVWRVAAAAVAAGLVAYAARVALERVLGIAGAADLTLSSALLELVVCATAGVAVYLALVRAMRVPEAERILLRIRRRFRPAASEPSQGE